MSEADRESKTEQPSQKRIADAVEKGNIPFSREVVTFASLLAALGALTLVAASSAKRLALLLFNLFDHLELRSLNGGSSAVALLQMALQQSFVAILPLLAIVAVGGVMGSVGQNVPSAALDRIAVKAQRISPSANFRRTFGKQGWIEFAKSLAKVLAVGFVLVRVLRPALTNGIVSGPAELGELPLLILDRLKAELGPICILAFVIAIADGAWSRIRWYGDLKMTRQEVKEELRQSEGDLQLKERIKSIARSRLRKRMMAQLPKATMVVVNPTHYAVALRYVPEEGGAPLVIAKGMDSLALKIKSHCAANNISVIEDKPLARALHKSCDIGDMIPPEFYQAVAEIIHFIETRKRLGQRRAVQG